MYNFLRKLSCTEFELDAILCRAFAIFSTSKDRKEGSEAMTLWPAVFLSTSNIICKPF